MSEQPTCDEPCPHGGLSATRKHSNSDLGHMGHCNRTVKTRGEKCWQHKETSELRDRGRTDA